MHARSVTFLVLLLGVAGFPSGSAAVERCKARVIEKTGAIQVSATGIAGTPLWAGSLDATGAPFANQAACLRGTKLKGCRLGAPGTLAEITPPAECRICVHDDGAATCCTVLRGCTPGLRLRDDSFPPTDPRFCQGAAVADPACAPLGTWRRETGAIFSDGNDGSPDLIVLDANGTGLMVFQVGSGVLSCPVLTFAKAAGMDLIVNLSDDSPIGDQKNVAVLHFTRPDATHLTLTDAKGGQATFALVDAPPANLACRTLTPVRRFDGLPRSDPTSGLAFDGTLLWYTEQQTFDAIAVDPGSGAVAATVDVPFERGIHAAEGSDFWTLRNDGTAIRLQPNGTQVDTVDPGTDLGVALGISSAAFDPAGGVLFLNGNAFSPVSSNRLLRVGSTLEPDALLGDVETGDNFRGLAFDGTRLWGVGDTSVVRFDPTTGGAVESFALPDAAVSWRGIAVVGANLALLGSAADAGTIVIVAP